MDGLAAMGSHAVMHECRHITMNPIVIYVIGAAGDRLRAELQSFALSF